MLLDMFVELRFDCRVPSCRTIPPLSGIHDGIAACFYSVDFASLRSRESSPIQKRTTQKIMKPRRRAWQSAMMAALVLKARTARGCSLAPPGTNPYLTDIRTTVVDHLLWGELRSYQPETFALLRVMNVTIDVRDGSVTEGAPTAALTVPPARSRDPTGGYTLIVNGTMATLRSTSSGEAVDFELGSAEQFGGTGLGRNVVYFVTGGKGYVLYPSRQTGMLAIVDLSTRESSIMPVNSELVWDSESLSAVYEGLALAEFRVYSSLCGGSIYLNYEESSLASFSMFGGGRDRQVGLRNAVRTGSSGTDLTFYDIRHRENWVDGLFSTFVESYELMVRSVATGETIQVITLNRGDILALFGSNSPTTMSPIPDLPSVAPTKQPSSSLIPITFGPTLAPPTAKPTTDAPTIVPTQVVSGAGPTLEPKDSPTLAPTLRPSRMIADTLVPTAIPTSNIAGVEPSGEPRTTKPSVVASSIATSGAFLVLSLHVLWCCCAAVIVMNDVF